MKRSIDKYIPLKLQPSQQIHAVPTAGARPKVQQQQKKNTSTQQVWDHP